MRTFSLVIVAGGVIAAACSAAAHRPVRDADRRRPPMAASARLDLSPLVREIDTNGDGRMSQAEWSAAGAPQSSFNGLDKLRRGFVTKADMDATAPPPGIDLNGDGRLTLAEFKAFDRRMSIGGNRPRPK